MPDIVRLLPDVVANQIAAGEVVQRPASLVKELLENALDAEATEISLVVKDAGKQLVQVIDNGKGMSATDARMSLERHATSKIQSADDLFNLRTMGFRGEALASIVAVAQVELRTRLHEEEVGTCIIAESSEVKKQEPVACPPGTSVTVKNLFYNVPARRNFLKSNAREMMHINEEFYRVALARPDIGFSFYQNDMQVHHCPPGKLSQRIVHLFGAQYKEQMAACKEETMHLNLKGYIGKPESAKKSRGEQYLFVNNRFIRSNYLNHAVTTAYEGLLPEGYFPFYVLFLSIDPKEIDVNVHPTKTEIKFTDEKLVYGMVRASVKQSLGLHQITPALDFHSDINFHIPKHSPQGSGGMRQTLQDRDYGQMRGVRPQQEGWSRLYEETRDKDTSQDREMPPDVVTIPSAANHRQDLMEMPEVTDQQWPVQLHKKYILMQVRSGMMLLDQQAAHERILFEQFQRALEKRKGPTQQSLFPETIQLNPGDFSMVMEMKEELEALGFDMEVMGKTDLVINGVPADIAANYDRTVFEGLLEQFKHNQNTLTIGKRENLARSLAKKTTLKAGSTLEKKEMTALVDRLFACNNPNYTPGGKPVFSILDFNKIESILK